MRLTMPLASRPRMHERFRRAAAMEQQFASTFYMDAASEIIAKFTKL
jgi:hypothetical protein